MDAGGIYVMVSLARDCPTCAVTRDQAPACYPPELKLQGQKIINEFSKYPNTLAFAAGNEVNQYTPLGVTEWNAPCQKKFIRDMREYIDKCSSLRKVPIGLISADNDREAAAAYYNCQGDDDPYEPADWYGLNSYVFCDGLAKTYRDALGFQLLQKSFANLNYSIPVLLTEFGCLSDTFPTIDGYPAQRNFFDAEWMLTEPELQDQFSGGFAFEYSIEMEMAKSASPYPFTTFGLQNYGVGYFGPENCDDVTIPCTFHPFPALNNLKHAYHMASNSSLTIDSFVVPESRQVRNKCPEKFPPLHSFVWEADAYHHNMCPREPLILLVTKGQSVWVLASVLITLCACFLVCFVRFPLGDIRLPILLSSKSLGDVDKLSEESAGLLSMQHRRGSSETSLYKAIDSDSSSDALEKLS